MRIVRLDLLAFGPFTEKVLDWSDAPDRLQIVLGRNEAGKSTSLRAVLGLLFGIDARTPDAHVHPYPDLRLGGILEARSGARIDVVRRKGTKGTLRDRTGEPIDEAPLRAMLRGVDLDAYRALYGLDHESLRLGADALERAQGRVGESLFDAGLGGLAVGPAIQAFGEEAEELWSPKARTRPLAEALRMFSEARKRARDEATSPEALPAQERGIEEARARASRAEAERIELSEERQRLRRIVRVSPGLDRRAALVAARAALGPVALLPESATSDREEAFAARLEASAKITRITREIEEHRERLARARVPRAILEMGEAIERARELASLAQGDAPERARIEGEIVAVDEIVRGLEAKLGAGAALDAPGPSPEAISETVLARDKAVVFVSEAEARLAELSREREVLVDKLGAAPPPLDTTRLVAAVEVASQASDVPGEIARETLDIDALSRRLDASLASLGLFRGDPDELTRLPVPAVEVCERAEKAQLERDERRRSLADRALELERRAGDRARDLEALLAAGAPPDEAELGAARAERDEAIDALERGEARARSVRDAVARADDLADRLRREAARVERRAQLLADRDAASEELSRVRDQQAALDDDEARARAALAAAFAPCGIAPLGAAEMVRWLARRAEIVEMILERDTRRARVALARAELDETLRALEAALSELAGVGAARSTTPPTLALLLAEARAAVNRADAARVAREEAVRALAEHDAKIERARVDLASKTADRDRRIGEVARLLEGLGLDAHVGLGEATARAADRVELSRRRTELEQLRGAVAKLEQRAAELRETVALVDAACGSELDGLATEPAARALAMARRFSDARDHDVARRSLAQSLVTLEASLEDESARLAKAAQKLADLASVAGVAEEDLPRAEAASREAARLDREIDEVEREIRAEAGASTFDELAAERQSLAGVDLVARIEELDGLVEEAASRRDHEHRTAGGLEAGLRSLELRGEAADHALAAEGHLARAATLLRRYIAARLAKRMLEREVERYRERHQTPILRRAEALFTRLTRGRYEALRVIVDAERPELCCVRGGKEVAISGLSDGTRDQLYLALRLATIERHAAYGEPMPLLLDDVFVHFDDDRTRAALEVLAEIAPSIQVLLFTHHERVVELAERAPRLPFALTRL
jgi:uncharacterized protein YhaN